MIAADHYESQSAIDGAGGKEGHQAPTDHKMDKMSKKDMANFDQAWLGMMVNDHQKDIAAFQRPAQQGSDPEVKGFAKKTLPVLQKHLKMVQQRRRKWAVAARPPLPMQAEPARRVPLPKPAGRFLA